MKLRGIVPVVLVALLLGACRSSPPTALEQMPGDALFQQLCASCHGPTGGGEGPVASLLKKPPPDLRTISQRSGDAFPADAVRATIDGRFERPAHGARDMPVWGWQFYDSEATDDALERARAHAMIDRLVAHVRSMQRPE